MKAIQGYITDDGEFFTERTIAEQHERTTAMKAILETDGMSEDILEWLDKRHREIANYLRIPVDARRPIPNPKVAPKLNAKSV